MRINRLQYLIQTYIKTKAELINSSAIESEPATRTGITTTDENDNNMDILKSVVGKVLGSSNVAQESAQEKKDRLTAQLSSLSIDLTNEYTFSGEGLVRVIKEKKRVLETDCRTFLSPEFERDLEDLTLDEKRLAILILKAELIEVTTIAAVINAQFDRQVGTSISTSSDTVEYLRSLSLAEMENLVHEAFHPGPNKELPFIEDSIPINRPKLSLSGSSPVNDSAAATKYLDNSDSKIAKRYRTTITRVDELSTELAQEIVSTENGLQILKLKQYLRDYALALQKNDQIRKEPAVRDAMTTFNSATSEGDVEMGMLIAGEPISRMRDIELDLMQIRERLSEDFTLWEEGIIRRGNGSIKNWVQETVPNRQFLSPNFEKALYDGNFTEEERLFTTLILKIIMIKETIISEIEKQSVGSLTSDLSPEKRNQLNELTSRLQESIDDLNKSAEENTPYHEITSPIPINIPRFPRKMTNTPQTDAEIFLQSSKTERIARKYRTATNLIEVIALAT